MYDYFLWCENMLLACDGIIVVKRLFELVQALVEIWLQKCNRVKIFQYLLLYWFLFLI